MRKPYLFKMCYVILTCFFLRLANTYIGLSAATIPGSFRWSSGNALTWAAWAADHPKGRKVYVKVDTQGKMVSTSDETSGFIVCQNPPGIKTHGCCIYY